jgi:hypothetical protein
MTSKKPVALGPEREVEGLLIHLALKLLMARQPERGPKLSE